MAEQRDDSFITELVRNLSGLRGGVRWNRFFIIVIFVILFLHLAFGSR